MEYLYNEMKQYSEKKRKSIFLKKNSKTQEKLIVTTVGKGRHTTHVVPFTYNSRAKIAAF